MVAVVEVFYDFRSPNAYFAAHRIREGLFVPPVAVEWLWRPVSIDILLNLQAGRYAWADYVDPLCAPKRKHLVADVRRVAEFYGAPLRPPNPARQNSIAALCVAAILDPPAHEIFRNSIFDALWQNQRDIADSETLRACLVPAGITPEVLNEALSPAARAQLAQCTERAYARDLELAGIGDTTAGSDCCATWQFELPDARAAKVPRPSGSGWQCCFALPSQSEAREF